MAGVIDCTRILIYVTTALALMAATGNHGVAVAQTPASLCATSLATLYPCVNYATSNVSTTPPPPSCCSAIANIVKSSVVCLCQISATNNLLGLPLNQTQVQALPGACHITIPAVAQCKLTGAPTTAPAPAPSVTGVPAPAPASTSDPAPAPSPSAGDSNKGAPAMKKNVPTATAVSPSGVRPTGSTVGISPPVGLTSDAVSLVAAWTAASVLGTVIIVGFAW